MHRHRRGVRDKAVRVPSAVVAMMRQSAALVLLSLTVCCGVFVWWASEWMVEDESGGDAEARGQKKLLDGVDEHSDHVGEHGMMEQKTAFAPIIHVKEKKDKVIMIHGR